MLKVLNYMFSKRTLPVLVLFLGAGLIVAFKTFGWGGAPTGKYEKILHNVGDMLQQVHYSPKKIDDEYSKYIFKKFLADKYVDEKKSILLQSDIQTLKKFETRLDDEILGGNVLFVPAVDEVMRKRLPEIVAIYRDILSKPFDFTKSESANFNSDEYDFPKNEAERKEYWRKYLKYAVLDRYSDLLENREKSKNTAGFVAKSDGDLEKEARERVLKIMERYYSERLLSKISLDDRFNSYINVITESMDPHTTFFPPVDKRYFDEQMSGRFFGIGASLREEDGNIKIATLLAGSPAWKSQQVQVGDIVLKVAQGAGEPVDLTGFFVEDAVKIIRGTKGTEVRLTLKKSDGTTKTVSLIRDEIVQDETFAKSAVINTPKGKIGFIYLPEFYADFSDAKGARCSEDVKKEIIKLKEQKVDGIVMDLRNNGGGSLYDVVQMVGFFIESGPIVQVKDREGNPQVFYDRDKSVLYDGPLAVMVNEFSASASEIFAAAIQDYNRGVIIGSTTTFGKGTVQRNIGLDKILGMVDPNSDLGTIKLTLQKFYRINGGSTQLKGVASDINLPDIYEYTKLREKDDPSSLPWDEIKKAEYSNWKYQLDLSSVKKSSETRIAASNAFRLIQKNASWIATQNDKDVTLNLKKYQEEQKQIREAVKEIESASKLPAEVDVTALNEDLKKYEYDNGKLERFKAWINALRKDIYLDEAVNVISDMVTQNNLVYNKK
ncbi:MULTISPECIES: carboxy terminal-processing peptidase [unclassified Paraflavitalea]|uniref:carboxy terminal-processing peptidase n=1 Tax=unclassified Paraflavitalea TaxID=2798305 RepID=UPI003D35346B